MFRPVDARRRVLLQRDGLIDVAALQGLLGREQIGGDAFLFPAQPTAHQEKPGTHGGNQQNLRHGLQPEARPKCARFDRGEDIRGKAFRPDAEVETA